MGRTLAQNPVSITTGGTSYAADFRWQDYYQKQLTWTNSTAARFEEVTVEADPGHAGLEKDLRVFLPRNPEGFTYDADGNLTQDGRWMYGWDAENRLIWMQSRADLPTAMPAQRVEFVYDYLSRRNVKRTYAPAANAVVPGEEDGFAPPSNMGAQNLVVDSGTSSVAGPLDDAAAAPEGGGGGGANNSVWNAPVPSGWTLVGQSKFVWDGWNLIAELDAADASVRTFAWGLDLSGSQQGAGGVGGLALGWTRATGYLAGGAGSGGTNLRYMYDGNGNVVGAVDDAGAVRARYEYGPFGETLSAEGDLAGDNPMRFSTKYTDGESGLVYYGYRYYNAGTGRWLIRDPMGENGGIALFGFVDNQPQNAVDALGLFSSKYHEEITRAALSKFGLGAGCLHRLTSANIRQDDGALTNSGPFADPDNHGDNNLIEGTIRKMHERIKDASSTKCSTSSDCEDSLKVLDTIGQVLHAVQDLYSHTDYVETQDKALNGAGLGDIPIWQFFDKDGKPVVPSGVTSGEYKHPLDNARGIATHAYMNKDKPDSYRGRMLNSKGIKHFDLARDVATRSSTAIWDDIWLSRFDAATRDHIKACCDKAAKKFEAAQATLGADEPRSR